MHLSSASPRGGPQADVGEYRDFMGTLQKIGPQCVHVWLTSRFLTCNPVVVPLCKLGYYNSGASAREERQRSTMGKKNW